MVMLSALKRFDSGDASSTDAALPVDTLAIADSASLQPFPQVATPESLGVAAAPAVDSQAIRDSLRRAARAEAAKKAAAAKAAESVRQAQETPRTNARRAVAAMLSNESASRSFARGATRMGGPLGTRRRGDLQTQIDALQPFLTSAGLTYEQFKSIVAESGIGIFDEFGRMVPDSLQRFASGN